MMFTDANRLLLKLLEVRTLSTGMHPNREEESEIFSKIVEKSIVELANSEEGKGLD